MSWSTDRGFTLVETLVVMVIVAILAAISAVTYLSQRRAGFDGQALSDLRNAIPVALGQQASEGAFSTAPGAFDDFRPTTGTVVCALEVGEELSMLAWHRQGETVFDWTSTSRLTGAEAVPLPTSCPEAFADPAAVEIP